MQSLEPSSYWIPRISQEMWAPIKGGDVQVTINICIPPTPQPPSYQVKSNTNLKPFFFGSCELVVQLNLPKRPWSLLWLMFLIDSNDQWRKRSPNSWISKGENNSSEMFGNCSSQRLKQRLDQCFTEIQFYFIFLKLEKVLLYVLKKNKNKKVTVIFPFPSSP